MYASFKLSLVFASLSLIFYSLRHAGFPLLLLLLQAAAEAVGSTKEQVWASLPPEAQTLVQQVSRGLSSHAQVTPAASEVQP